MKLLEVKNLSEYKEDTFDFGKQKVTLRTWLNETEYAQGFQQYYIERRYWGWNNRRVLACECWVHFKKSEVMYVVRQALNNVMTASVTIRSQEGVRLYLPEQDVVAQNTVLKYYADMELRPKMIIEKVPDPTRNIDNWWSKARYNRLKQKAEKELDRHGHAASIEFKVDGQKYEVVSDGTKTKVVKVRNDRAIQVQEE